VLIAAAACEMHPTAVLKGAGLRSVGESLQRATERARRAGVSQLPAIQIGAEVFAGEDALEEATAALSAAAGPAI
jgi:2-hydroxychromene-2-carboxylate isomerase